MADYSKWPEKFVSVTSLFLDPKNPRIPPSDTELDQRALIAELVEHDKVLDLVKDIAEDGYAPIESLIGWHDDDEDRTYILEGNRRLAALKLLLSPDSAPPAAVKRVRALAKLIDEQSIRKVRVLFAPSRSSAAPLIMQKHTRHQIERWSPLMQANFYRTLADAGLTASELSKQYGSTPGEVAEFLRMNTAYALACKMDLSGAAKAAVHDPREFSVSILQRVLDTPAARDVLGIEFDADGRLKGSVDKEEFKKAFSRIVSDIATNKENTRTLNTKNDVARYLVDIKDVLPDKKKAGHFTASDFEDKANPPPTKPKPSPPSKPKPSIRQSASVIPHGIRCNVRSARINDVFTELRGLKLEKNANASAVLFRIFLELCLGHYLDKTKKIDPLLAQHRAKGKPSDWYPTLRQMLDLVLKDQTITFPTLAKKKLNKLVSDKTSSLSVDGLDAYVHNRFSPPTPTELRHYWDTFEDLFAIILEEPPAPPKGGK